MKVVTNISSLFYADQIVLANNCKINSLVPNFLYGKFDIVVNAVNAENIQNHWELILDCLGCWTNML